MLTDEGRNDNVNTVNLALLLSFPTADNDVALMARPTYKIGTKYGNSVKATQTAIDFLYIGAGVSLVHSAIIPEE